MNAKAVAILVAAALASFAAGVQADEAAALTGEILTLDANGASKGQGMVTGKIASDFQSFAGSKDNATSLVTGLRNGSEITLVKKGEPSVTFTSPTRPMGFGNVSTSLALAKFQLAQQGITNPTPTQLQTALTGGSITANGKTVVYQGILQMRADGLGWGEIAQSVGTKLGPVVSGIKSQNQHLASLPSATPRATTVASTGSATASTASAAAKPGNNASSARGVVTASGEPPSAAGGANGKGHGNVATAAGAPKGQGIVTAAGTSATPVAQGAGQTQAGVVTASGSGASASASGGARGGGNGKALGLAK